MPLIFFGNYVCVLFFKHIFTPILWIILYSIVTPDTYIDFERQETKYKYELTLKCFYQSNNVAKLGQFYDNSCIRFIMAVAVFKLKYFIFKCKSNLLNSENLHVIKVNRKPFWTFIHNCSIINTGVYGSVSGPPLIQKVSLHVNLFLLDLNNAISWRRNDYYVIRTNMFSICN